MVEPLCLFPRTNRLYFPLYVALEAGNRAVNIVTRKKKSIYQRRIPFTTTPLYQRAVTPFFLRMGERERAQTGPLTTFLVTRKSSTQQTAARRQGTSSASALR